MTRTNRPPAELNDWQSAFLAVSQELQKMQNRLDKISKTRSSGSKGWLRAGISVAVVLVTGTATAQHWMDQTVTSDDFDPVVVRVVALEAQQPRTAEQLTQMNAALVVTSSTVDKIGGTTERIADTLDSMVVANATAQLAADQDRWCSRQLTEYLKTRSLTKKWPKYPQALEQCRLGDRPRK